MTTSTQKSKDFYDKKAEDYDNSSEGKFTRSFNEEIYGLVTLKTGDNILDVACGNGRLIHMLSQKEEINAYGIDLSEEMIKTAKRNHPNINFVVGNSENLPFEENSFDLITVSCAFHHFEKPAIFMKEAYRILKKGGILLIAEPIWYFPIRNIANLIFPFLKTGDVRIYSQKELQDFLIKNHFYISKIHPLKNQLYILSVK